MNFKIYSLKKLEDDRGWFSEIFKLNKFKDIKQINISLSKKGAIRGQHYHKRKIEWFCVISGKANMNLKNLNTDEEKNLLLSDENLQIIEILPFTYHKIESLTDGMMLLIGVNEIYNKEDEDTFH